MATTKITKEDVQETVEKVAKEATKQAKAASKAASKAAEKATEETKKAVKRAAAKRTTSSVTIQYAGKEIDTDALVKSAKDIWRYDMGRKMADLKNVDIYVKPEENRVYYVLNDETGSFEL